MCALAAFAQSRNDQLDQARNYMQSGRYYEAEKIADQLLAVDPNDADAKAVRDDAARRLHDMNAAKVAAAEAAAHRAGATDRERYDLANAYYDAGSYGSAAAIYAKLPPDMVDGDTRLRYARSLAWSGRLDDAERVYSQILAGPHTPDVDLEYGRLLSWMGASKAAVTTLQRVYDTTPSEDAAIALANAEAWSGNREAAIQLLTDYTNAHPGSVQATQLVDQLRSSPDLQLERIDRMIEAQPYNLALQVQRARLQVQAGRYAEALKTVRFVRDHTTQKLPDLDTIERQAKEGQKREMANLDQRLKALDSQQANMASSSTPGSDEVLSLAKAYSGLGAYDRSEKLYARYLKTHPDDVEARTQYARVLSWDAQWVPAEEQYQILLRQHPDRADLRYEYGTVQSYNADFNGAMHTFHSLTDLSSNPRARLYPDVPAESHYNLGQIYRWYGWNDHAVAEQNAALSLDPGYVPARTELDLARHARPASTGDARYTYVTDSNDFTMKRVDLGGQKWVTNRTAFDLSVGRHDFEHLGENVYADVISGGADYRSSDRTLLRGRAGANFYDNGLGTRPFWGFGAEWMPSIESRAALDYNHYDLVYDVFTLTSLTIPNGGQVIALNDPLSIDDLRGHYDYATGGHWSWLVDASYGRVSDSNRREGAHGLLSYRILKAPFIAVKADGRYLAYDFRTNRYWSPPNYRSLAGVLQVGTSLFHQRFSIDGEVKYGKAWESGFSSDLRAYEGNVTVPVGDRFDIVGNYGYGKSGRLDSIFGTGNDFVNYWQRHWFVGVRVKQLFAHGEGQNRSPYYYDNRVLNGSPVIPPLGEAH